MSREQATSAKTLRASTARRLLGALAVASLGLRFVDPAEAPWLPFCLFHALTGLHCPGCGATRALHALVHGELSTALHMNALLVAAIPALALASLRSRGLALRPRVVAAAIALTAAFGIARNVPGPPFSSLAPLPRARTEGLAPLTIEAADAGVRRPGA